jgi:ribosomal protein L29
MKKLKTEELSKLSSADLVKRLDDLRSELSKLRTGVARGTLKKERGEIKSVRRNIARVLTAINTNRSTGVNPQPKAPAEKAGGSE